MPLNRWQSLSEAISVFNKDSKQQNNSLAHTLLKQIRWNLKYGKQVTSFWPLVSCSCLKIHDISALKLCGEEQMCLCKHDHYSIIQNSLKQKTLWMLDLTSTLGRIHLQPHEKVFLVFGNHNVIFCLGKRSYYKIRHLHFSVDFFWSKSNKSGIRLKVKSFD